MDVSRIEDLYTSVLETLQAGTESAKLAIKGVLMSCLGGMDGGIIGWLAGWAIGKVIDAVMDLEGKALSIALRCEYMYRAGKASKKVAERAWNLTNKCSSCGCIGHNKQNHSSDIDDFLRQNRLLSYVEDAEELAGMVEEDATGSLWDWL